MPERKLTVFLVDDESIIRNGMKKLFDWESNGFTITGEAENGRDALPFVAYTYRKGLFPISLFFAHLVQSKRVFLPAPR